MYEMVELAVRSNFLFRHLRPELLQQVVGVSRATALRRDSPATPPPCGATALPLRRPARPR